LYVQCYSIVIISSFLSLKSSKEGIFQCFKRWQTYLPCLIQIILFSITENTGFLHKLEVLLISWIGYILISNKANLNFILCHCMEILDRQLVLQTVNSDYLISRRSYHQDNWEAAARGKDPEKPFRKPRETWNAFDFIFRDCLTSHKHSHAQTHTQTHTHCLA